MNQQINLYQPMFRKQNKVFSAVAMLQVTIISILFFSLSGSYSYFQLQKLRKQEQGSSIRLDTLQKQIVSQQTNRADDSTQRLLESEINRLRQEIVNKKQISAMLARGTYSNTEGFSRHLEAIARQHVEGSWLTRIEIHDGGAIMHMDGITFSAELLPVYLQRLLQEEVFSGTSFNVLGMQRSAENEAEISFEVSTKIEGGESESS